MNYWCPPIAPALHPSRHRAGSLHRPCPSSVDPSPMSLFSGFSHRPCPSSVDPYSAFFCPPIVDALFFCPSIAHVLNLSICDQRRSSFFPPIVISRPSVHPLQYRSFYPLMVSAGPFFPHSWSVQVLLSIDGQYRSFFCPFMVSTGPSTVRLSSVQVRLSIHLLLLSIYLQYRSFFCLSTTSTDPFSLFIVSTGPCFVHSSSVQVLRLPSHRLHPSFCSSIISTGLFLPPPPHHHHHVLPLSVHRQYMSFFCLSIACVHFLSIR